MQEPRREEGFNPIAVEMHIFGSQTTSKYMYVFKNAFVEERVLM